MKVPPKRKGKRANSTPLPPVSGLNESPSEKEGKSGMVTHHVPADGLNESPSEKEGKLDLISMPSSRSGASMKVPPKRKGNRRHRSLATK